MNDSPAIRCRGLVKDYGSVRAVDGLDLEVRAGECFGLLGPNGAGKTTTVEILEGLLPATSGEVELLGRNWKSDGDSLRERHHHRSSNCGQEVRPPLKSRGAVPPEFRRWSFCPRRSVPATRSIRPRAP